MPHHTPLSPDVREAVFGNVGTLSPSVSAYFLARIHFGCTFWQRLCFSFFVRGGLTILWSPLIFEKRNTFLGC